MFGPTDGVPDFVDEFDDGSLAPEWAQLLGSATESGGVVALQSPGTDYSIGGPTLDVSNIEHEEAAVNGAGSFTATSFWLPVVPGTDAEFHFQLYGLGGVIESAGCSFTNRSAAGAAGGAPGTLAGPAIAQQLTRYEDGTWSTPSFENVAVSPGAITGQIALRLAFDDGADTLACSFSLDGGATFQSPFTPVPVFDGLADSEFLLGAGAQAEAPPPPPPGPDIYLLTTRTFLVRNSGGPAERRLLYRTNEPPGGGQISLPNPVIAGATFHVKLDGTSQCFQLPASGWTKLSTFAYRYLDPVGLHGAVRSALIKIPLGSGLKIKVLATGRNGSITLVPPDPGTQAETNLRIGFDSGFVHYCGSTAGAAIPKNNAIAFKAVSAPAPSACLPACSPSGAFLDPPEPP